MIRFLLVVSLFVLASGAAPVTDDDWATRGTETLKPFKTSLQAALKEGLAKGPKSAISVCSLEAPELARKAGSPGVRVGRATNRPRNPDNAAEGWLTAVVDQYAARKEAAKPRVVHLGKAGVGYAEPIYVQSMCLMCHGESIPDEVRSALAEKYPADKATGYREGDFRGVFWVEFATE